MKDFLLKIKKSLKTKEGEILYVKKSIKPNSNWKVLFSSFLVLLVLLFSFSFYFYYQINLGQFFSKEDGPSSSRVLIINQKFLEKITSEVEIRRLIRENTSSSYPSDPSL